MPSLPTRESLETLLLGDLLRQYPESRAVLYNHFGGSCFNCPAVGEETLVHGIRAHGVDADAILADLMEAIRHSREPREE